MDKLAQQVVRNKHKLIDVRRHQSQRAAHSQTAPPEEIEAAPGTQSRARKPMTVEEAMLQIEELGGEHLTYRDADSGNLRVLLRRRDGRLELIEAS